MKNKSDKKTPSLERPSADSLRKLASELREMSARKEEAKTIKCAKYMLGMTALAQLQKKLGDL